MSRAGWLAPFAVALLAHTVPAQADCAPAPDVALGRRIAPAVVKIATLDNRRECVTNGTGFVISPDGYVLTAGHVVPQECDGQLIRGSVGRDSTLFTLTVVERSALDVALLRIEASGRTFPFLSLVRPVGDIPAYEDRDVTISSFYADLNRPVPTSARIDAVEIINMPHYWSLCATAANPGRSGSPVVLADGTVVAVFTERPGGGEQDRARILPVTAILDFPSFGVHPPRFTFIASPAPVGQREATTETVGLSAPGAASAPVSFAQRSTSDPPYGAANVALTPPPADRELRQVAQVRSPMAGAPGGTGEAGTGTEGLASLVNGDVGGNAVPAVDFSTVLPTALAPTRSNSTEPDDVLYEFNLANVARARRDPNEPRARFLLIHGILRSASRMTFQQVAARVREGAELRLGELFTQEFAAPAGFAFDRSFFNLRIASQSLASSPFTLEPCTVRRYDCYEFSADGTRLSVRYWLFAGPLGNMERGWINGSVVTRLVANGNE